MIYTPPPPSALTLLATLTPTVAASLDALTLFSGTYDAYLLVAHGLKPVAASDTLRMRLANAGVADATSGNYAQSAGDTALTLGAANANGIGFVLHIAGVNDAALQKLIVGKAIGGNGPGSAHLSDTEVMGTYLAANAASGFRLLWAAGGNFQASGKVRIYGMANA